MSERSGAMPMHHITSHSTRTTTDVAGASNRPARGGAWGRTLVLLIALVLGSPLLWLRAQKSKVATTTLVLTVVPEERMALQGNAVSLKIRLASGTTARLWAGTSCGTALPASLVITRSGAYSIQPTALGVTYTPAASEVVSVCLLSSDGLLHDSVAIRGAVLTAPASVGTEASTLTVQPLQANGSVTTTSAGVTTASSP
jgi:hypothetical protein